MKHTALVLMFVIALTPVLAAVDGDEAMYVGGTLSVKEKAEGTFSTQSPTEVVFATKKNGTVVIPYTSIESLEYGQKAGRRVAVAVMVSPLALFSKKRNHYLTIAYKDQAGTVQPLTRLHSIHSTTAGSIASATSVKRAGARSAGSATPGSACRTAMLLRLPRRREGLTPAPHRNGWERLHPTFAWTKVPAWRRAVRAAAKAARRLDALLQPKTGS